MDWANVLHGAQQLTWLEYVVRGVVVYIALITMVRLMGQREITQLTAVDFIVAITIGTIAASPLSMPTSSIWAPLLSVLVVIAAKMINTYLGMKSQWFERLSSGEPVTIIKNGKIQEQAMKKGLWTLDALMAELRRNKVFSLNEVELAILEPSGKINVLKKREQQPVTKQDLAVDSGILFFPAFLVKEGRILRDNLEEAGLSEAWLRSQLQAMGVDNLETVFAAQLSTTGVLYVDTYDDTAPQKKNVARDLILIQIKKLEAQLRQFAQQADDTNTRQIYQELNTKAQQLYQKLTQAWGDRTSLITSTE